MVNMAGHEEKITAIEASGEVTTKDRILNVAIDLFAIKGFDAVSLREIADAAGVRKATLYYYFTSKDEILEKILEYVLESWDQSKVGRWSDSADAEAQILALGLDGFMDMAIGVSGSWLDNPRMEKIMRISFIECYHNAPIRDFMLMFFGAGPGFFETSFAILMKHKLIKSADPKVLTDEYMSFYMMALVDHFILRYGSTAGSFVEEYRDRIEKHNEFFKNAIRP